MPSLGSLVNVCVCVCLCVNVVSITPTPLPETSNVSQVLKCGG